MRQTVLTRMAAVALLFLVAGLAACDNDGLGRYTPPVSCHPNCVNRMCGTDGCGHTCGTCDGDLFCEPVSGLCLGDGDYMVTGSIRVEYMFGDAYSGTVQISGPEEAPAVDLLLSVIDKDGNVIGANFVEGLDGGFSVPVSRRIAGNEKLVLSTLWAPAGEVEMAVLDSSTSENDPGATTFDPFAWYIDIPAGGNVGEVTITTDENSGALFVFLMNKLSFDNIVQPLVDKNRDGNAINLAILYGPWDSTFVPCTCFQGDEVTYVGTSSGPKLTARISIVDMDGYSSAWGWAVLFHEFGHYVLGEYSKDNSTGGSHYIGQLLAPKFAFSEGWATFMSLVTATLWFGETWPVYWDIQGYSGFYVDFEAGMYYDEVYGSSSMLFPDVKGSVNQDLDENWVARALYILWDGSGTSSDPDAGMTLDQMTDTISSDMFLKGIDWPRDADLNNFLNSAICLYPEKNDALTARVHGELSFPYYGDPECRSDIAMVPDLPQNVTGVASGFESRRLGAPAVARTPVVRAARLPIPPVTIYGVTIDSAIRLVPDAVRRDAE